LKAITLAALLGAVALWPIACNSTSSSLTVTCAAGWDGCSCTDGPSPAADSASTACDETAFPGTTCCADPGWPSAATTCSCHTGDIYCGIVPAYFMVASCSGGGAPIDSGGPPVDASPFGTCSSNADCDPMFQFCQKATCDASAMGTCATRPGQRQTYYCSPGDGGGTVCGCDGQTWGYACLANAQGVNVASQGPCPMLDGGNGQD